MLKLSPKLSSRSSLASFPRLPTAHRCTTLGPLPGRLATYTLGVVVGRLLVPVEVGPDGDVVAHRLQFVLDGAHLVRLRLPFNVARVELPERDVALMSRASPATQMT